MSDKFHLFAAAVHAQFTEMSKHELFVVDITGDALYGVYQAAFPAGTNEMFRKAREHECSTCRNFIKNLGNVVAIVDRKIVSVWDVEVDDPTYSAVTKHMAHAVRLFPINSIFRAEEPNYGANATREMLDGGQVRTWHHFYGALARQHHVPKGSASSAAARMGEYAAHVQVLTRGVTELTRDAIVTVSELIMSNNLYRGTEFALGVGNILGLQSAYNDCKTDAERNIFLWSNAAQPGARIKNTAIGTLLEDLSAGVELERAVKSFEDKVSGTNYKRPAALITPRMVEDAMKTINAEGIEPSLHRRLANATDLSVTNVLYVDNALRGKMQGGVANLLAEAAVASKPDNKTKVIPEIGIEAFMVDVLPKAKQLELLVSNAHQGNFVTLTAPVHADAPNLFKWDNQFGWSYDGNITDSIKERVKAAGGAVDGALRISLAWFNHDDLDLHVIEPSGQEIYFGSYRGGRGYRGGLSPNGGMLDVDMNAGGGSTREPVENVTFDRLTDGVYRVVVHNYSKRETRDPGFTLEVAVAGGQTNQFSAAKSPSSGAANPALTLTVKNGAIVDVVMGAGIEGRAFSQEKWGVQTEQFTRVDSLLLSPNHWDGNAVGNKHFIFILDGCKTDVPARGIYNEFLKPEYDKHRKVFEVLGNKMMCDPVQDQLSGVGFSSTRADKVVIRVNGHQHYNVSF